MWVESLYLLPFYLMFSSPQRMGSALSNLHLKVVLVILFFSFGKVALS